MNNGGQQQAECISINSRGQQQVARTSVYIVAQILNHLPTDAFTDALAHIRAYSSTDVVEFQTSDRNLRTLIELAEGAPNLRTLIALSQITPNPRTLIKLAEGAPNPRTLIAFQGLRPILEP